jgi:hypothetical protein
MNDRDGNHGSLMNQVRTGFCVQCLSQAERRGDVASMDFGVKQDGPDHQNGSNQVWSGVDAKRTCMMHSLKGWKFVRVVVVPEGSCAPEEGTRFFRTERPRGAEAT